MISRNLTRAKNNRDWARMPEQISKCRGCFIFDQQGDCTERSCFRGKLQHPTVWSLSVPIVTTSAAALHSVESQCPPFPPTSIEAPHSVESRCPPVQPYPLQHPTVWSLCPPLSPTPTAALQTKASFSYFTPSSLGDCVKAAISPEWGLDVNRIGKQYRVTFRLLRCSVPGHTNSI